MERRPWVVRTEFLKGIEDRNIKLINSILESGFDIDTELMSRKTAISICVSNGWFEMAVFVIGKGCSLSLKTERGETPLHLAVLKSDYKMVKLLLENRADLTSIDELSRTPLHHACELNNLRIATLLIEKANRRIANIRDKEGRTPLMYACQHGCLQMICALISKGTLVNVRDCYGVFPLIYCLWNPRCSTAMINTLLDAGANINERNPQDETALLHALKSILVNSVYENHSKFREICMLLIERGSNVNAKNNLQESVLYLAVELGDENLVRKVLNYGCDVNSINTFETLDIFAACSKKAPNILALLIDSGATFKCVYEQCERVTPLVREILKKRKALPSLRHSCRCTIRRQLQKNIEKGATELPLPPSLINYLILTT